MSKFLHGHQINDLNISLSIEALDEPGPGGAHDSYQVIPNSGNAHGVRIDFHRGPFSYGAVPKGLTHEALLAIIEDRLLGFQTGPYACRENACALTKIQEAIMWLNKRTRDREARGVEGTSIV